MRTYPLIAGTLAAAFTAIAYWLCGATLGLFLCGLFAAGLLIGLLDDAQSKWMHRVILAASILDGVAVVWLTSVFLAPITFLQWLQAYTVLLAVASGVISLRLLRVDHRIVAILFVGWFVSPAALAHAMLSSQGETLVGFLTRFHPLFAMNRIVIEQGAWTNSDLAYRLLTPLGQDVAYALPESIWPCVMGHLMVTVAGGVSAIWIARRGRASIAPC